MKLETTFSPCRKYRYTLWREFFTVRSLPNSLFENTATESDPARYLMVIGLNPSTADETKDDPTIRKCIAFAKLNACAALCMTNLFAFRATDPRDMRSELSPVGEDNDVWLERCAGGASLILAAWGKHGNHMGRAATVTHRFADKLWCLGTNLDGSPKHPLYVPYTQHLIPFSR